MSDSTETEPDFVTATVTHHPRRTDVDPRAAKRAEHQVATMFVLAALLILASVVAYVVIPVDAGVNVPFLGPVGALNLALGLTIGLGILLIGLGAIHWARKLMPGTEVVAMRHEMRSEPDERQGRGRGVRPGAGRLRLRAAADHPPHADRAPWWCSRCRW